MNVLFISFWINLFFLPPIDIVQFRGQLILGKTFRKTYFKSFEFVTKTNQLEVFLLKYQ